MQKTMQIMPLSQVIKMAKRIRDKDVEERMVAYDEFCMRWVLLHPEQKIPLIIFEEDIEYEDNQSGI